MIDHTQTPSPEWQNENALRAYPLLDDAPAAAVLPAWLLADLRITVSDAYGTVFLSSAYLSDTLVSFGISATKVENGTPKTIGLLVKTVVRDTLQPFRTYGLDRLTDGSAAGSVTFGEIPADATGFKYAFGPDEAPLSPSAVVRVTAPGVTSLVDPVYGSEIDGLVDLSGNSEFRTSVDPTDPTGQTILVTLADLYRDLTTSVCNLTPSFDACGRTPITSVNGVTPDANGVLTLKFT